MTREKKKFNQGLGNTYADPRHISYHPLDERQRLPRDPDFGSY